MTNCQVFFSLKMVKKKVKMFPKVPVGLEGEGEGLKSCLGNGQIDREPFIKGLPSGANQLCHCFCLCKCATMRW